MPLRCHQQSKVIALCLYRDVSGMFTTESRAASARDELSLRTHSEAETLIQDIRWVLGALGGVGRVWGPSRRPPGIPSRDGDVTARRFSPGMVQRHGGRRGGDALRRFGGSFQPS